MISPEYCQLMARYNAWQNTQLNEGLEGQPPDLLMADRGAFFGSILGTLNHLVWGDLMWMARFAPDVSSPGGSIARSVHRHKALGDWHAERLALDRVIARWADRLTPVDLAGSLAWRSAAAGRSVDAPMSRCIVHMFNHQTHHRGQVHAMMTAAGLAAPVSDLFLMPEPA